MAITQKFKTVADFARSGQSALNDFMSKLDEQFGKDTHFNSLVDRMTIDMTRKTVYLTGIGKNKAVAEKTAVMLRSIGLSAHSFDCVDAMHGDLGVIRNGDVVIAISKSGNTAELIHMLKYLASDKICVSPRIYGVCLSRSITGFDAVLGNNVIHLPEVVEVDDFNKIPTTSNIALQMFFDAVAMSCASTKYLTLNEFVGSHPGGTIGETQIDTI